MLYVGRCGTTTVKAAHLKRAAAALSPSAVASSISPLNISEIELPKAVSASTVKAAGLKCNATAQNLQPSISVLCLLQPLHPTARSCLQEAASAPTVKAARLKRFAAALKLDSKHHIALVQSAALHNLEVGNYG